MDTVRHNLGRGRRPGQHSARRVGALGCRQLPRGHGSAARSRSTAAAFGAVGGITKSDRDSGAAFSELRGRVIVRRVRNDSQQAGRVRGSGLSTAQQSSDAAGSLLAGVKRRMASVGGPADIEQACVTAGRRDGTRKQAVRSLSEGDTAFCLSLDRAMVYSADTDTGEEVVFTERI